MLTVTEKAKAELRRTVERSSLAPNRHLRLAMPPVWTGDGDFGIVIDEEGERDQVVTSQGLVLLFVDGDLGERLSNAVLDFKAPPGGEGFTLDVY
ncbi:MAG: hypothetical protein EXR55_04710 [Dehalococcoidia bacterium]|nr:hypothetical protein [Dehalococcoidia bacterium]